MLMTPFCQEERSVLENIIYVFVRNFKFAAPLLALWSSVSRDHHKTLLDSKLYSRPITWVNQNDKIGFSSNVM